jgi:hypothetical protein
MPEDYEDINMELEAELGEFAPYDPTVEIMAGDPDNWDFDAEAEAEVDRLIENELASI